LNFAKLLSPFHSQHIFLKNQLRNTTCCVFLSKTHTAMSILQIPAELEHCQPRLTASLRPGCIRLHCWFNGAPAVRLQMRYQGGSWFTLLEACEASSIEDRNPVEVPGLEEIREYRAIGVWEGEEIGQASEVVSVTLPG
jgi:hypothetical protein